MNRILVLDPESLDMRRIASLLETRGYAPFPVADSTTLGQHLMDAAAILSNVVILGAPGTLSAKTALPQLPDLHSVPLILFDPSPTIATAVSAIKAGAADYLSATAADDDVIDSIDQAITERARDPLGSFTMVGASVPMQQLLSSIAKVGPTSSTVLITGESGTGKELVARALHAGSQRRLAALISLNCAMVPDDLIEAELFGHPGEESNGLLATAAGGTLFLDEVGELPAAAQSRLLQALESNQAVRLISATHRDLAGLVANGQFRHDLYYRLKVVSLSVPSLKDRDDDVLLLADAILTRTMEKLGKSNLEFAASAREDMRRYPWPGNVRELENAIHRAVILTDDGEIDTAALAIEPPKVSGSEPAAGLGPDQTIEDYFVSFVTTHQDAMTETELAEKLGISRKSLWERRQRLNIPRKKTRKRGKRRDVS